MKFLYQGRDSKGAFKEGELTARSRKEAITLLKQHQDIQILLFLKDKQDTNLLEKAKNRSLVTYRQAVQKIKPVISLKERKKKEEKEKSVKLKEEEQTLLADILKQVKRAGEMDLAAPLKKKMEEPSGTGEKGQPINIFLSEGGGDSAETTEDDFLWDTADEKPKVRRKKRTEKREPKERSIEWKSLDIPDSQKVKMRIRKKHVRMFTKRLSILLHSGVSLSNALYTLQDTDNKKMKKMIQMIYRELQEGNPLSSALAKFPKQFDKLFIAMVSIGETSGTLAECLSDVAAFQEKQRKIQNKIRSSMIYPGIVFGLILIMMVLGSIFLIPTFEEFFMDMDADLPFVTHAVFAIAKRLYLVVLIPLVLGIFLKIAMTKIKLLREKTNRTIDRVVMKVPFIKTFATTINMFYFSHTLALMIKNGIRILDSLQLTRDVVKSNLVREDIEDTVGLVMEGTAFSQALYEQPHFETLLCDIVATGEESGKMHYALSETAQYYGDQVEHQNAMLMEMIQPVSILLIAAMVVPVLLALFLPILDMTTGTFV